MFDGMMDDMPEDKPPRFVQTGDVLWDNEEQVFWVRKPVAVGQASIIASPLNHNVCICHERPIGPCPVHGESATAPTVQQSTADAFALGTHQERNRF